jgi:hypothetical protein
MGSLNEGRPFHESLLIYYNVRFMWFRISMVKDSTNRALLQHVPELSFGTPETIRYSFQRLGTGTWTDAWWNGSVP